MPGGRGELIDHVHQGLQFRDRCVVRSIIIVSSDLPLRKGGRAVLSKLDDLVDLGGGEGGQMNCHLEAPVEQRLDMDLTDRINRVLDPLSPDPTFLQRRSLHHDGCEWILINAKLIRLPPCAIG